MAPFALLCEGQSPAPVITITTNGLPNGVQNEPYSGTLSATGGVLPYTWSISGSALDGFVLDAASGEISGTPTKYSCCNITATVVDSAGNRTSGPVTLSIAPRLIVGRVVSAFFQTQPACRALGTLPPGLQWSAGTSGTASGCVLSGTPTSAGSYSVVLTSPVSKLNFDLQVRIGASEVPGALLGVSYSQSIVPQGGTSPYEFAVTFRSLPQGLTLDTSTGLISGAPARFQFSPFKVRITDSSSPKLTSTLPFSINVDLPPLQTSDVGISISGALPGQQINPVLNLSQPYPIELFSFLVAQFFADPTLNFVDPTVGFINASTGAPGKVSSVMTLPANTTSVTSPTLLNTGTSAGEIIITTEIVAGVREITPTPTPYVVLQIPKAPPVIESATSEPTSGGFDITVTGFSTSRDLTQATFQILPTGSESLSNLYTNIDLTSAAAAYFSNPQNSQYGSRFSFTLPFRLSGGAGAVKYVVVTLSNSIGSSQPASVPVTP
jgi:hypothetical protein